MHYGGKSGEIRVLDKAVRTRTTPPSFRKTEIEHYRNSQRKSSHSDVCMTEYICD